jgi:3-hydroxybutyrate dehydrogenase
METTMRGRSALVTGATGGLGFVIAERLLAAGARVMINGLVEPAEMAEPLAKLTAGGGTALYHRADLADAGAIAAMMAKACDAFGTVDIVVNNAVVRHLAPIENFPPERWSDALAVNLSAPFHIIRSALPGMRAKGWGRIVNIASIYSFFGVANRVDYVTTKTGLLGLTRAIAVEVAGTAITCNAICPGPMPTPGVQEHLARVAAQKNISVEEASKEMLSQGRPNSRLVSTEAVAGLIVYLCSDDGRDINGAALPVDAGLTVS